MTLPATMRPLGTQDGEPMFPLSLVRTMQEPENKSDPLCAMALPLAEIVQSIRNGETALRRLKRALAAMDLHAAEIAAGELATALPANLNTKASLVRDAVARARTKRAKLVHRERQAS